MIQKVLRVGSSAAVTIPKKSLIGLGIKIGDTITVYIDHKRRKISITPETKNVVDKELIQWTKSFMKQYKPALEALAKK